MKIIVPCCGSSSRFPGQPPKWMLPAQDGRPMISMAIAGLKMSLDDLIVTILREHEEKYQVTQGLQQAFGRPIRTAILDERTGSQSETVAKTLRAVNLQEPFLVKDSDGYFELDQLKSESNYICCDSLNHFDSINPRNKSYLQVDHKDTITNIREKVVISDLFNVGGYYFTSPERFLEYYDKLQKDSSSWSKELYLSDVIGAMVLDGIPFRAQRVTGYRDWGTAKEWRRALLAQQTFFVLLDGFVFERGSLYFRPRFEDVQPQPKAIESLQALATAGHQIKYLTIRPESLAKLTQEQLVKAGAPEGEVLWNCPVSKWVLLTAPHPTLPFLTSQAMEFHPDEDELLEKINTDVGLN